MLLRLAQVDLWPMEMLIVLVSSLSSALLLGPGHIITANPTAPNNTPTPSHPNPRVMTASPVCKPGLFPVPVAVFRVVAVGALSPPLPLTIITAVDTVCSPFGPVDVSTSTLVCGPPLPAPLVEPEPDGVIVVAPPPIVVITGYPCALVVVIT